jgi:choline monooxygenase
MVANLVNGQSERVARLQEGQTLPADWYTNPAILELEQEAIFKQIWHYVGLTQNVAQPGQYFTCRISNVPVVVVRDLKSELRAFVNVCPHRFAEVARGAGRTHVLRCPYHVWTFGLDGSLQGVPRCDREPDFDKSSLRLVPAEVESWGPLIFVNLSPNASPLQSYLGVTPDHVVASTGIAFDKLKFHKRTEFTIAANWKVVAENFVECYHCPSTHPEFSRLVDVDPAKYLVNNVGYTLNIQAPLLKSDQAQQPYNTQGVVKECRFTLLWPNCTFSVMPGQDNLIVYSFIPINPHQTYGTFDYFFGEDVDDKFVQEFVIFSDRVGIEDVESITSVQRGLQSGVIPHGRLLLDSEHSVQYFQKLVDQSLTAYSHAHASSSLFD